MSIEDNAWQEANRLLKVVKELQDERDSLRSVIERIHQPFCPKCGVVNDLHMNLYCRKVQSLTKGIERLKRQLAEAKKGEAK
jgi:hypothetical protein